MESGCCLYDSRSKITLILHIMIYHIFVIIIVGLITSYLIYSLGCYTSFINTRLFVESNGLSQLLTNCKYLINVMFFGPINLIVISIINGTWMLSLWQSFQNHHNPAYNDISYFRYHYSWFDLFIMLLYRFINKQLFFDELHQN